MSEPPAPPPTTPPSLPFGPQTLPIRRFLQRLAALAPAEQDAAAAEYDAAQRRGAVAAADRELERAIERSDRTAERDALLGPLLQIVQAGPAPDYGSGDDGPPLLPVAEAALAAALALLAHDLISARAFATLYAPFAARIPAASIGLGCAADAGSVRPR